MASWGERLTRISVETTDVKRVVVVVVGTIDCMIRNITETGREGPRVGKNVELAGDLPQGKMLNKEPI